MFFQMMDTTHWIWASLVVLCAIGLSAVCIHFRKGEKSSLCGDCRYNDASLCTKKERPFANACTSYRVGPVELEPAETDKANIAKANIDKAETQ